MEISFAEVVVEHSSSEVVGPCIHQTHFNGGVYAVHIDHSLALHRQSGGAERHSIGRDAGARGLDGAPAGGLIKSSGLIDGGGLIDDGGLLCRRRGD